MLGRLAPGISIDDARAEMKVLDRWRVDLMTKTSPSLHDLKIDVESAATGMAMLRDRFGKSLVVLSAIAGLMLLIACANVAGLLLARGAARQREMALRLSLGAARSRLVRQLLTESTVLATIGGMFGVLLAYVAVQTLTSIVKSGRTIVGLVEPIAVEAPLDASVMGFTAGLSLLSALLFGLGPAWHAFRSVPAASLRDSGSVGESRSRRLFARSLIVVQIAVSLVLLSAASLFINHVAGLRNDGVGFDRRSVLLVTLDPAKSGYELPQLFEPYQALLARLQVLPGVRSATLSGVTPIHGAGSSRFVRIAGFEESPATRRRTFVNWVAPRYFETFGTPLVAGRDFSFDDRGRAPVVIVNQAFERHYFPGASAIGQPLSLEGTSRSFEIIGVVADAKYLDLRQPPPRTVYLNSFQESRMVSHRLSIRTDVSPLDIANDVQQTIAEAFTRAAVANVTTLTDQVNASIVPERLVAALSGTFGTLGAVLVGIGLYGLLAYSVARRTNEIGVRMALGATRSDITRMILAGAAWLTIAGVAAGIPIALWSRTLAAVLLPQLHVESPTSIAVAAAGIVTVALLSSWVPAWRASRIEPAQALRCD
jgi:predicted permease